MRYYAAHAVSDVTWNEATKQYHAFVQGSNIYGVTIGFGEDEQITHSCNCPAHAKYPGACKHVVAALLFIADSASSSWLLIAETPASTYDFIFDYCEDSLI